MTNPLFDPTGRSALVTGGRRDGDVMHGRRL
jgi:hypothetical protein